MKSKLMTIISIGALALSAVAPSAMARVSGTLPPSKRPNAVSGASANAAALASKNTIGKNRAIAGKTADGATNSIGQDHAVSGKTGDFSKSSAVPPHTILNGAKDNPF